MSLEIDKLGFDFTDADTTAASASVGAFVRASDGTLITHTALGLLGVIKALDVNVANDIQVTVDGIYAMYTNDDPDNIGLIAHVRQASPGDADQTIRTTGGVPADAVVNANVHALDVNSLLMGYNGSTWDRLTSRALTKELQVIDYFNTNIVCVKKAVDDTVGGTQLLAAPLTSRKKIIIQNVGAYKVYLGKTGVADATGLDLNPGANLELPAGPAIDWYAICATSGKSSNLKILEAV